MSRNPPHKWHLIVQPPAQKKFDGLQKSSKQAIFRHLRELLNADDPLSLTFVEMLQEKRFARARKFRAGDYRILFTIEPISVVRQNHTFKGTLFILDIRDRKEAY